MNARMDAKKTANMAAISSDSSARPAQNFFTLLVSCLNINSQYTDCMEKSFHLKSFIKAKTPDDE